MKKMLNGMVFLFIISFLVFGCAPYTNDMRLSNSAYEDIIHNKYKEAEQKLHKALQENPDNHYAQLNLGVIYHDTGRYDKAKEMYKKVIDSKTEETAQRSNDEKECGKRLVDIAKYNLALLEE